MIIRIWLTVLKLVIVGLGIFGFFEIVALLRKDQAIADRAPLGAGWLHGVRDWWHNKWLSMRCALIGVVVGSSRSWWVCGGLDHLWPCSGADHQG